MAEAIKAKGERHPLDAEADAIKAGARVFAFCRPDRFNEGFRPARCFFTGCHEDLDALIEAGGHELLRSCDHSTGWTGFVPFSNHEFFPWSAS